MMSNDWFFDLLAAEAREAAIADDTRTHQQDCRCYECCEDEALS